MSSSQTQTPTPLRLAVCLYPRVTSLDFIGPMEVISFLHPTIFAKLGSLFPRAPSYSVIATYLSHNLEPVTPVSTGPKFVPEGTYSEQNEQFDVILVPGGMEASPEQVDPSLVEFIKKQTPGAKYILSVCTGSWLLAGAGVLDGKNATTNKALFKVIQAATNKTISWIPKARWVVDGNVWTSSGVTTGIDMANAFVAHLVGEDIAELIRGWIEFSTRGQEEDEFAAVHGLL